MGKKWLTLACVSMTVVATSAFGKPLPQSDQYMCSWGAGTAAKAQELKLSGVSLYASRQKIQSYKFAKGWMRMMAMGITEQTYESPSKMKPAAVRTTFLQDCLHYRVVHK